MGKSKVIGQRQLSYMLRKLPEQYTRDIRDAIADGAQLLLFEAQSNIMENGTYRTGALYKNIRAKVSRSGLSAKVGYIGKRAKRRAYYAWFVERGTAAGKRGARHSYSYTIRSGKKRGTTRTYNRKVRRTHPGNKAKPFLFPALRTTAPHITARIADGMRKTNRKIARLHRRGTS